MSIQPTPYCNLPIYKLPNDQIPSVWSYLKPGNGSVLTPDHIDQEILATAEVCKAWRDSKELQRERQEAKERLQERALFRKELKILHDYPLSFRPLFLSFGFHLPQLPVLDLGDRNSSTGHISFLHPRDMRGEVMRFKDALGRPGLALHLKGKNVPPIQRNPQDRPIHVENKEGVLTLFRRYKHPDSHWTFALNLSMEQAIQNAHLIDAQHGNAEQCPDCPFLGRNGVNERLLRDLLTGQNRVFQLAER